MKVITLTQPWAVLMAIGAKHYETRSWSTSYRGPLGIHAAKGWTREDKDLCSEPPFVDVLELAEITLAELDRMRGSILAVVELVDVVPLQGYVPAHMLAPAAEYEEHFGNYGAGRYAWVTHDVLRLASPVVTKGMLGLWTPPTAARAEIDRQALLGG